MITIVTFGEVMMRLSPANFNKLSKSNQLNVGYGGTEMNVAASLACFGLQTKHVTALPNDFTGDAALSAIKSYGIDTSDIQRVSQPIGLYFLEVGAGMRPSQISYNRLNAAFAHINADIINWESIFNQANWFHWTGITPGISKSAYIALKKALEVAKSKNITVTCDPAYRKNLWNYGIEGKQILKELVGLSTIFIGGTNEINEILDTNFKKSDEGFQEAANLLMNTVPSITAVYDKIRIGVNASWQKVYGQAWVNGQFLKTDELEITHVVDRIGTGDAFAAGLIYGLKHWSPQQALEFANAACALKHTINGDVNLASVEEINELVAGNSGGRIKR